VVAQRSPEWIEARRLGLSSTDIPILLGLSPYKSEAALAREKMGTPDPEQPDPKRDRMMRLGLALESVVRAEEEIEHGIRLRRVNRLLTHPTLPWAVTSLDFERVGEKTIVEVKSSRAGRWDDGLPQDVEAQCAWQMLVSGYPRVHVALLRSGSELQCFDLEHDPDTAAGLVVVAEDFRRRLDVGGPFAENAASVKARWPADDGGEMVADADTAEAVRALLDVRARRSELQTAEERLETAIKQRMADAAVLIGQGFRVTWRRTRDTTVTDWKSVADGLLRQLPDEQREPLVSIHTTVRAGFRPLRVVAEKEKDG